MFPAGVSSDASDESPESVVLKTAVSRQDGAHLIRLACPSAPLDMAMSPDGNEPPPLTKLMPATATVPDSLPRVANPGNTRVALRNVSQQASEDRRTPRISELYLGT